MNGLHVGALIALVLDGKAQAQGGGNITFNAPPAQGTTHAPPVVGMSVEQQRREKR